MANFPSIMAKVNDLIPYARNSRTHSDEQVTQIAASIKEFGFTNPVLIDKTNGIIAGHGRVMAAKKLGLKEVPCIVADGWTDAQKKAYIIADNKLALNSGWDYGLLKLEIENLKELDFDIDLIGFDPSELTEYKPNYDLLEDEDVNDQIDEMASGVKKAIQIEFEPDHYQEAQELVKFWRQQGAYVGKMIMDFLSKEKNNL
jgi:ParB-like chromosome segregation protein Spo0J